MSTWFAVGVFLAAATLTYLFCIRPMRRGQRGMTGCAPGDAHEARQREELPVLRDEIAQVRRALDSRPSPPRAP